MNGTGASVYARQDRMGGGSDDSNDQANAITVTVTARLQALDIGSETVSVFSFSFSFYVRPRFFKLLFRMVSLQTSNTLETFVVSVAQVG